MPDFSTFLSPATLEFLFLLSIVTFLASLIAIPVILVRLPQDYFREGSSKAWLSGQHPILRVVAIALKNLTGAILIVGGLIMLVLPGQGLLTLLIGVSLMDFPGKRALERSFVRRPAVLHTINRIRKKFHRPPLHIDTNAGLD